MKPIIKAVVFDLDDTLISESHYQNSAQSAIFHHLRTLTGKSLEEILLEANAAAEAPRDQYFQSLLPRLGLEPSQKMVHSLIEIHRGHLPVISWYSDVIPTLNELRLEGAKLGIITDGYSIAQHQKLLAVKAAAYFDAIVVSDDLGREYWKPHCKPFLTIASDLGIDVSEVMYVGDNPEKDFYISSELPVTTVKITRDDSLKANREYWKGIVEDYSVDALDEVVDLYTKLNAKSEGAHGPDLEK